MKSKTHSSIPHQSIVFRLVVLGVALNGIIFIAGTLLDELVSISRLHEFVHIHTNETTIGISLVSGLTLLYLSSLLIRRKRAAWFIAILVYALILAYYTFHLFFFHHVRHMDMMHLLRYIILPAIILIGLVYYRYEFKVRSTSRIFNNR